MFLELDKFYRLQDPLDLWNLAKQTQSAMSAEDFLSRGKDFEQKVQEALVASTFSLGFQKYISPVQIQMKKVHEELLDFELQSREGPAFEFEITTTYEPGYKIREEYKNGKRPKVPERAFSGDPVKAEWIAPVIRTKTEKARKIKDFNRHLLVYQNISGGGTDLERLKKLIPGSESIWRSIWLIVGVPDLVAMVLLCNTHGFSCAEREWLLIGTKD